MAPGPLTPSPGSFLSIYSGALRPCAVRAWSPLEAPQSALLR